MISKQERIFNEQFERERAKDAYKSEKEAKAAKRNLRYELIKDGVLIYLLIHILKSLRYAGIANLRNYEKAFILLLILDMVFLCIDFLRNYNL
jgi:hypothetical protein